MTPEERRKRVRELMAGLEASEINVLIAELRRDIADEQSRHSFVQALLAERRGYEQKADSEGVRQVDEQLERHGHVPESPEMARLIGDRHARRHAHRHDQHDELYDRLLYARCQ